jgi:hypothetical protein
VNDNDFHLGNFSTLSAVAFLGLFGALGFGFLALGIGVQGAVERKTELASIMTRSQINS